MFRKDQRLEIPLPLKWLYLYSHNDVAILEEMVDIFQDSPGEQWIDWNLVEKGAEWWPIIQKAILDADAIHIYWCCHACESHWVTKELEYVLNTGKPVMITRLCDHSLIEPIRRKDILTLREAGHTCTEQCHGRLVPGDSLVLELPSRAIFETMSKKFDSATYVLAAPLDYSKKLRSYSEGVQERTKAIMGDSAILVPLEEITFPLAVLAQTKTLTSEVWGVFCDVKSKSERLKNFNIDVCGPHLMPDMTVSLQVKTHEVECLLIRALSQRMSASLPESQRGFSYNINHISLATLSGEPEKVRVLYQELNRMREENIDVQVSLHARTLAILVEDTVCFGGDEYRETIDLVGKYNLGLELDSI